jgi:anoctamin-10
LYCRVKDWLHGIIHTKPLGDSKTVVTSDTPAEALRSAYHLVTWTKEQGGAGITPGHGTWKRVTSSFPPQDALANRQLLKYLAGKTFLKDTDLDRIRALFGEKVDLSTSVTTNDLS